MMGEFTDRVGMENDAGWEPPRIMKFACAGCGRERERFQEVRDRQYCLECAPTARGEYPPDERDVAALRAEVERLRDLLRKCEPALAFVVVRDPGNADPALVELWASVREETGSE